MLKDIFTRHMQELFVDSIIDIYDDYDDDEFDEDEVIDTLCDVVHTICTDIADNFPVAIDLDDRWSTHIPAYVSTADKVCEWNTNMLGKASFGWECEAIHTFADEDVIFLVKNILNGKSAISYVKSLL